jgi:hypothetical protein
MRSALTLFLLLAVAPKALAQNWLNGSLEQALAQAKSENKAILVDFISAG